MAYIITSQCISCSRCQFQCPTGAIKQVEQRYWIDPSLCNNCVGHYNVPQCAATCPTNSGCVPDFTERLCVVSHSESSQGSHASLRTIGDKAQEEYCNHPLLANDPDPSDYWDSWFRAYNRSVAQLHMSKQSGYWYQWFDKYSQEVSKKLSDRKRETAGVKA